MICRDTNVRSALRSRQRGLLLNPFRFGGGGGGGDPDFANVKALLHFDGTAGTSVFTDVIGNTFTPIGSPQLSADQVKFGTTSGAFDGISGQRIVSTSSTFSPGSGDYTVEFWYYPTRLGSAETILTIAPEAMRALLFTDRFQTTGNFRSTTTQP